MGIQELGDLPDNFTTPGHQPQWAWAEGNQYKLFGCVGVFRRVFAENVAARSDDVRVGVFGFIVRHVGRDTRTWQAFLYDIVADRAETTDLWRTHRTQAKEMLTRFLKWQTSVFASQQADEIGASCHN